MNDPAFRLPSIDNLNLNLNAFHSLQDQLSYNSPSESVCTVAARISCWGKIRFQVPTQCIELSAHPTPRHLPKNAACFSTSSFFVEVGRFRVSSCFQENSHCWWIIMYLYTLYIVRGIHILLQMHFVAVSDRHHYSVHQICRDTWKDSDCVWFLPLTKKAQWPRVT